MTTLYAPSAGDETQYFPGLSRDLWRDFPDIAVVPGQRKGANLNRNHAFLAYEDFIGFGKTTAISSVLGRYIGRAGVYTSHEDSGNVISAPPTILGGCCRLACDNTDNDLTMLQYGDNVGGVIAGFSNTAADAGCKQAWFEAQFRVSNVTLMNHFIGFGEEASAAADWIGDDATFADKDYLGFHVLESAATTLTFRYHKAGQTAVIPLTSIGTLAVDTWYKVGFRFVPVNVPGYRSTHVFEIYFNGAPVATGVTATQVAAATFPSGEEMSPLFATKTGAGAAVNLDIRRWAYGQCLPTT
jgi:hypothetical protein